MKSFKDLSILSQLIVLITIATVIPLVFLGYTTYSTYIDNRQAVSINSNFDTLNQAEHNISNLVRTVTAIINQYDNNTEIKSYLSSPTPDSYEALKQSRDIEETLNDHLATIGATSLEIVIMGENGEIYNTSNRPPNVSPNSVKKTYWYQETMSDINQIRWFIFDKSYFTENLTHPVVVAVKSLEDYTTGKRYGTIIIEIDEYYLYDLYKEVVNSDEYFMVQDSQGNIITTSDRTVQLSLNSSYSSIDIEQDNLIYDYQYKNSNYIYISQKSSIADWTFIKLLSIKQLNNEIRILQRNFIIIYLACLILVLIGVYFIAFRITKPIKNLTYKIQNNYTDDSNKNIVKPFDLSITTKSYEVLIEEVDDTIRKLINEKEAHIDAELYALRMQINPHFLYNTLNSIKCLVWTNKSELIEPTITSLVKLLQQTLKKPGDMISLKEELALLKHYVYIQNIRTDNSITLNDDIPKKDYNILVPSLILQPIVENAIFHGIEPMDGKGTINLSSYTENGDFFIEVFDNGIGISDFSQKNLLEKKEKYSGFNGIGLDNINQRLKIYYGNAYGLTIKSQKNIGTSVTIRIKAIQYSKKENNHEVNDR